MRKLYAFLLNAFILTVFAANQSFAQNYTFTTTNGNSIIAGTTLVPGSQADDATVNVPLPFTYQAYGVNYNAVNVSTNGNIQFTTNLATFTNACPMPTALGVGFLPYWDDLLLTGGANGIYTSISGLAPNRIFNIEWRGVTFSGSLPVNMEARLFEGRQRVDFIYGNNPDGSSATIGVQGAAAPTTLFTQFSCNTVSITSGLRISFVLAPTNDVCSGAIPINCGQTINGTTADATVDAVASCVTSLNTAPGVWYTFLGDGTNVTLSLCGSAYDTKIGVFRGTCAGLVCVTGNDDFCGLQSQVTFASVPGTNYYILVTGFSTASGAFSLARSGVCLPPCVGVPSPGLITGPSGTLCGGTPVVLNLSGFSVGTGLTFQWKSSTTPGGPYTNIPGATTPTYAFSTTTTQYFIVTVTCTVSGLSANTTEFAVNVNTLAHINAIATPSTVCAPGATLITGTATGGNLSGGIAVLGTSGTINLAIPDNTPAGVSTTITLPASNIPNAASLKVRINMSTTHTWVGDLIFRLTSPCGTTFLFDRPGVPASGLGNSADLGGIFTFDLAGATVIPEAGGGVIPPGIYRPSDANGAPHNWAGLTFPCTVTGNWTLNISDNAGGDVGTLGDWQILGPGVVNYTHTLTGPGTIVQNPPSGPNNANASFNVTGLPAGSQVLTLTTTDGVGCTFSTPITVTVNPLPAFTIAPSAPVICAGAIQPLTANVVATGQNYTFTTSAGNAIVPGTTLVPGSQADDATVSIPLPFSYSAYGTVYPSVRVGTNGNLQFTTANSSFINTCPLPSATMGVAFHPHWDDLNMSAGGALGIYTSISGVAPNRIFNIEWRAFRFGFTNPVNFEARLFEGQQRVDFIYASVDNNGLSASIGVQSQPTAQQTTFSCNAGSLSSGLGVSFTIPPVPIPVTFSPLTDLFTDAGATTAYTGTLVSTVYARPSVTRVYTATATALGCSNTANVTVTVNQSPAITTHPLPAAQTICPGFNVVYTVGATGAGLTYQWRKNGVNLVNAGNVSGVTTSTLTLSTVSVADNGTYDVVVNGTCAPSVISNGAVLTIATPPTITTQPANRTVCAPDAATFSVVVGGVPTPNIFQWQVSTTGPGGPWVNLTTGGSYTNTLTVSPTAVSQSGSLYRVIVTNSCGQSTTSNNATLTVNAPTPVVITALPPRICLSDTLVNLSATPVGGSWSGIGVSGFNFVPPATSIGTYTLTYTYVNALGCTSTGTVVAKVEDCPERIRQLDENAVILFPNPNNGRFNIRINSVLYNFLGMNVYNTIGQRVRTQVFNGLVYGRVVPIDLGDLPGGTYMVKFFYDDGIRTNEKTFPVVIQR